MPILLPNHLITKRNKWDLRFLDRAKQIAQWSKDPSGKVGAVIVNGLKQVVGEGYNGFPRKVVDSEERYSNRELKLKYIVHAELNAILLAGDKAKYSIIYVYPSFGFPPCCHECCKAIIQSGIVRIVGYKPKEKLDRWKESMEISKTMCSEAGVEMLEYEEES